MFRIGDFSRLTRVSVKMLRHYDEIGLLTPIYVDPATSYRYYTADQLPRLNRIIALKDLGFSLDQIGVLLNEHLSLDEMRGMLKLRRAEVEQAVYREQQRLAQIEAHFRIMIHTENEQSYDVVLRKVEPQLMATIRQRVPSFGRPIAQLFDEVEAYVAQQQARAVSCPLMVLHDAEYRATDCDIEVAVPLTHAIPATGRVGVYELSGALMACVVYTGSYARLAEALHTLLIWVDTNAMTTTGPLREVYLRFGAANREELQLPRAFIANTSVLYVTEIQLPVAPQRS